MGESDGSRAVCSVSVSCDGGYLRPACGWRRWLAAASQIHLGNYYQCTGYVSAKRLDQAACVHKENSVVCELLLSAMGAQPVAGADQAIESLCEV